MRTALALLALLTLAACASYMPSLPRGVAAGDTQAKVQAVLGKPSMTFEEGGATTWVYSQGINGFQARMVRFGADGKLSAVEDLRTAERFSRVKIAMTREQVARLLGPASREDAVGWQGNRAWDYRFMDDWGYPSNFSVTFNGAGYVVATNTWRENYHEEH